MMRILRKSNRTGKPMSKNETVLPNQEVVPRFVVRQLILLFRMTHLTNQNMNQICAVLAPELKSRFEPFANIEIKPLFNDLLELIQVAEAGGFLSPAEATSIRNADVRNVSNPIPDVEATDHDGHEKGRALEICQDPEQRP